MITDAVQLMKNLDLGRRNQNLKGDYAEYLGSFESSSKSTSPEE